MPLLQVLDDMYDPDGGLVSLAARDYYYQHYATADEQKKMEREEKFQMALAIIFIVAFLALVTFSVVSAIF